MQIAKFAAAIFILLFLIVVLIYTFQPLGQDFYIVANSTLVLFSFLAVVLGFRAYRSHQFSDVQGKALFFLATGIFLWFLGETTWSIYEVVIDSLPIFSIGDVFWLSGYPMFLVCLYYVWKLVLWPINKKWFILCAIILLVVSVSIWYVSIPILTDAELSLFEKLVTAGYVLGDMLVLDALVIITFYLSRNKISSAWNLILLAMATMTLADVIYAREFATYASGSPIDVLWDLSYIIFAFAFFYYRVKWQSVLAKTKV